MFDIGDTIVHSRYGAGKVVGEKVVSLNGEERSYICIELTGDRGTLMVQPEEVDPEEVRETLDDLNIIREVFNSKPQKLSDQHRSRQPRLQAKIRSNDPKKVAEALRDLVWRERVDRLTETDKRIMNNARRKLMQELKISPQVSAANRKLNEIVEEAIHKHLDEAGLLEDEEDDE